MEGPTVRPDPAPGPDRAFEDLILRQGLLTPQQLDECRRVRDNVIAQGLQCDLEEVLIKKGLVNKSQVAGLHAALGRGNKNAIEGYEILSKLGAGGQGAVYKARQSSMDRLVAIKVLLPKYAKEKDGIHRFIREGQAIARLNHPNIVSGIDAGYSNGAYYYVMEYVEGETLDKRIHRLGRIPAKEAVSILRQTGAALKHAHENGLVHRDIKPANIILTKDGTVKLTDLGMARFAGEDGLTLTGFVVGTPHYISPEQARGGVDLDTRSDLYSLGITLYEMLSGKPPFKGDDPLVVLNQHLKETVRFVFPDLPPDLLAIGHHLTERDRARRYADPGELLEDLEALEQDRPLLHARAVSRTRTARMPAAAPRPRRSRAPIAIGAVAAGIALLAGAWALIPGTPEPPNPNPPVARELPKPPEPAPQAPARGDAAMSDADKSVLAALARARQYEIDNPGDLEEIAARYSDLEKRAAGSAEEANVRRRASEAKAALATAIEKRKTDVAGEAQIHARARKYGPALESLDRHARDYRSAGWAEWIAAERGKAEAAMTADARKLREASRAAEEKQDFEGAAAPMRELQEFGVASLSAEATERIQVLETARNRGDADRARRADADKARLASFLDRADAWAAERSYEKIEPAAPAVETESVRDLLKEGLARYRGAQDVFQTALRYAVGLAGKTVKLQMRDGTPASGRVEAVQERPARLLLAGKSYDVAAMSAASLAEFYRSARGSEAVPESLLYFAILDGDATLAEELLKKKPMVLEPRYKEMLRKAAEARPATEESQAKKEKPPAPKKPELREVVVHVNDLPRSAFGKDIEIWDEASSPGGKMAGISNDGDLLNPTDPDAQALFKVQVQAGVPYRCWVHMKVGKPKGNSQANALAIQFTNAVDKAGKEIFTLGTPAYLSVRAPSREGWLWIGRDASNPKAPEPVIYFRVSGEITVRVGVETEGVGFDQLVLSPARYLEKPPAEAVVPLPKR